ncbi:unnamed protein product [Larinioides sclopetarius]|uniref:Uncharacterized protein n=1 Tax=Larinioides sclopetarius TaxID=280406 RepID=A0AAV1ZVT2_9ARAC
MHPKFIIAVLSLFVVLKPTKAKYISMSPENIYQESSEILSSELGDETSSTSFSDDPSSTDSDVNNEQKTSLKDIFKIFNKTNGTNGEPDVVQGFWPYIPYIIFAVVVLGLIFRCFYKDKSAFSGSHLRSTSSRKRQFQ